MDTIEFRFTYFEYALCGYSDSAVDIFINGENLLPRIHEFEDSVGCNGGHAPMWLGVLYDSLSKNYKTGSVPIYCCGCGEIDCSAIYITVEVGADTVTWKDFILPDENLSDEIIYQRRFGEFVFDRTQYFREVDKLKRWNETDSLTVEYGGVECGEITLVVMKGAQAYNFYFDECLDDPLPALVKFFNAVRDGDDFAEAKLMRDDGHIDFKLSFKPWTDGKIRFVAELVWQKVILCEYLSRDELADMLKRIFDALLTDKYFPYSYPCFDVIDESENFEFAVTDAIEADHPDWSTGDVLNYAVENGLLKLLPRYEEFLAKYRRMLTDYVVPEGWL